MEEGWGVEEGWGAGVGEGPAQAEGWGVPAQTEGWGVEEGWGAGVGEGWGVAAGWGVAEGSTSEQERNLVDRIPVQLKEFAWRRHRHRRLEETA